jgi:hypothetical protein
MIWRKDRDSEERGNKQNPQSRLMPLLRERSDWTLFKTCGPYLLQASLPQDARDCCFHCCLHSVKCIRLCFYLHCWIERIDCRLKSKVAGWWLPEPTVFERLLECVELLPGLPLTLCVGWLPGWTVVKHLPYPRS